MDFLEREADERREIAEGTTAQSKFLDGHAAAAQRSQISDGVAIEPKFLQGKAAYRVDVRDPASGQDELADGGSFEEREVADRQVIAKELVGAVRQLSE